MRLKDIFRRKDVVNLKDTTNIREKELIRKISRVGHLRLKLTSKSKFRILENSAAIPPTVTFELVDYPGHVLRAKHLQLFGERRRDDETFVNSSSFFKMPNLWYDGFVSFESTIISGHYIRLQGNDLILGRYDGSEMFKEECSFKMTKNGFLFDEECSFKNEWVTDEAGVGLVLEQRKESDQSKVLLVPEDIIKLPGLSPIMTTRRKQPIMRKYSEASRNKKLVTFNQQEYIYENEPVNWSNGMSNIEDEGSLLNAAKKIDERDNYSCNDSVTDSECNYIHDSKDGTLSNVQMALKNKDEDGWNECCSQSEKRCRKTGEVRFANDLIILQEEENEKRDEKSGLKSARKNLHVGMQKEDTECCDDAVKHGDDDSDDDNEDDDDGDDDNEDDDDGDDDNDEVSHQESHDEALDRTMLTNGARYLINSNNTWNGTANVTFPSYKTWSHPHIAVDLNAERFSSGDERKMEQCMEQRTGEHCAKGTENKLCSISSGCIYLDDNGSIRHDSYLHPRMPERQMKPDNREVSVSIDNLYVSQNEIVLVCLPDEPRSHENREFDYLTASERERVESDIQMSPCDGALILKKMNRKTFHKTELIGHDR